ncbi:MAG: ankyrin repeat domain-containing protein [Betaproteobacteria bacterium]|nr:ankyrin repeat domain-containing protein [Betaproteobacteria bacterium]
MSLIQRSVEKDDLLTRLRIREVALFSLIALTAVLANLPEDYIDELGLNRDYLLAGLGSSVVIGLFLYLRFFFFFSVVLLFLGANLPDQIAQGFGISKIPLILALVAMVGISLINYVVKLLPTGLEPKPKEKSPEGVRAMFYAVEKNNVPYAQRVMSMNFDPNLHHDNGYTPLAYAALRGNLQMVEVLLRHGADPALPTREGETAVELALRAGHKDIADLLKRARQEREARGASAPAAGAAIAR